MGYLGAKRDKILGLGAFCSTFRIKLFIASRNRFFPRSSNLFLFEENTRAGRLHILDGSQKILEFRHDGENVSPGPGWKLFGDGHAVG